MSGPDSKGEQGKPAAVLPTPVPVKPEAARSESAEPPRPAASRSWSHLLTRAANVSVLVFVALACAYLLTPGLFAQRIPYGEESIGQFSNTVVKANRDYDIPDEEMTLRLRQEAREAVLPVYDYDTSVAEVAVERLRSAFRLMQEAAAEVERRARLQGESADEPRRKAARRRDEDAIQQSYQHAFDNLREEWQRRLEIQVDDETFRALAEARFSEEVAHEAERLLVRANGQMVAEYRDPLALAGGGVVVRRKSGGQAVSERVVVDIAPIRDQTELRREVELWATQLPNDWPPQLRKAVGTLVSRRVRANLRFNREETEERRNTAAASVKPVIIQLKKGEKIIGDGERIERRHLVIFSAIRSQTGSDGRVLARLGSGLFAALLLAVVYGFARGSLRGFRPTRKDAVLGAVAIVVQLGLVNLTVTIADALHDRFPSLPAEALYYAAPFAAGAMLLRFVLTAEAATVFTISFASLSGVVVGNSLEMGVYALIGSLVAAAKAARANDRASLFRAGVYTGLVNLATIVCLSMVTGKMGGWDLAAAGLAGFLGGALGVPMLVMGFTPLVEAAFGYTTDIKLLELANLNHPALKELIVQAPGTYHHSIIIGSLVEAAAEAIGANPLLARVSAYYHDIGKGKNPLYFGENQRGANKHEKLAPQMSALIIKRHVTDGMEMARQYKLPKQVADVIPQHHGTRLVGYFFHKALKEQEGKPDAPPLDEALFRYPGPKPQTREAALVMIADAVEASSRAMQDPTPPKLQALVQKIINSIFADGQLDECDLTLRDLNAIARAFYRTLGGIYHTRPDYPPQAVAARPALAEVKDPRDGRGDSKLPIDIRRAHER